MKALNESEYGKHLVDYLRRFLEDICDIRTIPDNIDKKTIAWISKKMESDVMDKINLQVKKKDKGKNEYE